MKLNSYILAGGKSSRMGEDKGLVLFNHKPLIEYVIEVVQEITPSIFILTSNQEYLKFGYPLIEDIKKEIGPAGAIATLLAHSAKEINLVLACDMPFIDKYSIEFLIQECIHFDITVPLYNNYPEALLGIYNTNCGQKWQELIDQKEYKMSRLLSAFKTNFVDGNKMATHNKHLFKNMNFKEDLIS